MIIKRINEKVEDIWYHGSKKDFDTFKINDKDIGIHFGTKPQALKIINNEGYLYKVNLSYSNSIELKYDVNDFSSALELFRALEQVIYIPESIALWNKIRELGNYSKDALDLLRSTLQELGYDSILYPNQVEGEGISACVFDPSQITIISKEKIEATSVKESTKDESLKEEYEDIEANVEADKSDMLAFVRTALREELTAIDSYENKKDFATEKGFTDIAEILNSIQAEEKMHVGELQYILDTYDSVYAKKVNDGKDEAEKIIDNENTTENLNRNDIFAGVSENKLEPIELESFMKDTSETLNENVDLTDYDKLLETYYGKEAVDFMNEQKLPAKSLYLYLESHATLNPLIELKAEISAEEFNREDFIKLY